MSPLHHYDLVFKYRNWRAQGRPPPPLSLKSVRATPASAALFEDMPLPFLGEALSCKSGSASWQRAALNLSAAAVGIGALQAPSITLFAVTSLLFVAFCILLLWRFHLVFVGLVLRGLARPLRTDALQDHALPVYSILVPAYREAALMPQLAKALSELDWPSDKLDIQILLEAEDTETQAAARRAPFPPYTRCVVVPPGSPRTKPRALNYGLMQTYGRFVTVYDVEDLPHPEQLKAAYANFAASSARVVCLQAPLMGDNSERAWIAAQWSLEYAVQFGLLLPSLALYRMPILIGGTSNHFRKDALLALGGWDPWNVTEDADLGMRIARAGLLSGVIACPTYEDAPETVRTWLPQRRRWLKGFVQSWLVLMRTPKKTWKQMGGIRFAMMQVTLGGALLAPLFHAPFAIFVAVALISGMSGLGLAGLSLFIAGLLIGALSDVAAPGPWRLARLLALCTRPLYWPLHSVAAYQALYELAKRPFFWAKTPHRPRFRNDTCSTGLSASASPPGSSPSGYSPIPNSALSAKKTNARTKSPGD